MDAADWLHNCEGYVTMSGKEAAFGPQAHDMMAVSPQTKPPRGYVAHNAPVPVPAPNVPNVPNGVLWNKPVLSDGYVQMGCKGQDGVDDKEDLVGRSECIEEAEPMVRPPNGVVSLVSPSVVGLGAKVSRGDECERTSVEVPLVATRTPNGYVAHPSMGAIPAGAAVHAVQPQAKAKAPPAMRHEYVRTAEKNPCSAKLDTSKPYTRLGEREPASQVGVTLSEVLGKPSLAPALTATPLPTATPALAPTTSGYVPHIQFENRATPTGVRE